MFSSNKNKSAKSHTTTEASCAKSRLDNKIIHGSSYSSSQSSLTIFDEYKSSTGDEGFSRSFEEEGQMSPSRSSSPMRIQPGSSSSSLFPSNSFINASNSKSSKAYKSSRFTGNSSFPTDNTINITTNNTTTNNTTTNSYASERRTNSNVQCTKSLSQHIAEEQLKSEKKFASKK